MKKQMYQIKLNSYNLENNKMLSTIGLKNIKSEEEEKAMLLLHRICNSHIRSNAAINRIDDLALSEDEQKLVVKHRWDQSENIEIKARCNDVLCRYERDKRKRIIAASENYLLAYKKYRKIAFLYRSIAIRNFKQVNNEQFLQDIIETIKDSFEYPFWIKNIVEKLQDSYSNEALKDLALYIKTEKEKLRSESKFSEEREYIRAQYTLKSITEYQYHKELSLSYEKEADDIANNKASNTIYPSLKGIYQKAYDEIFIIKENEEIIVERIKKKLLKESNILAEMIQKYGVKSKITVNEKFAENIDSFVATIELSSFKDTIILMLSIPFVTKKEIDGYQDITRKAGYLVSELGHSKLNNKGHTVGSADAQQALRTEAHRYFRVKRLYAIYSYIMLHYQCEIKTNETELYNFLKNSKPSHIEEENLVFWTKGILAGLNNDFITASSILTPQLEHALHNIAESIDGNITTLEKKRQLSPTLGSILPRLKDVFDEEVFFEVDSFLQGEIDENFRNNLLHGLLRPDEVDKQGRYLWWICLKIYFMKLNDAICDHINNPNSSSDNE